MKKIGLLAVSVIAAASLVHGDALSRSGAQAVLEHHLNRTSQTELKIVHSVFRVPATSQAAALRLALDRDGPFCVASLMEHGYATAPELERVMDWSGGGSGGRRFFFFRMKLTSSGQSFVESETVTNGKTEAVTFRFPVRKKVSVSGVSEPVDFLGFRVSHVSFSWQKEYVCPQQDWERYDIATPDHQTGTGNATFAKYDDGWRLDPTSVWPRP